MDYEQITPAEKVIYIDGSNRLIHVDVLGSALRFDFAYKPKEERILPIICPLHKIIRINNIGKVLWSSEAITECANHGIIVSFTKHHKSVAFLAPRQKFDNNINEMLKIINDKPIFYNHLRKWENEIGEKFGAEVKEKINSLKINNINNKNIYFERRFIPFFENWLYSELNKKALSSSFMGQHSFRVNVFKVFSKILRIFLIPISYKISLFYASRPNIQHCEKEKSKRCARWFDGNIKYFYKRFAACWSSFLALITDFFEEIQNGVGYSIRY